MDQEWGFLEVLRNASTCLNKIGTNDLDRIVHGMDCRMDGLLSCTDILTQRANSAYCSRKGPAKDYVGWNRQTVTTRISHDWKDLEHDFLMALIHELNCTIVDMEQALADAGSTLPLLSRIETSRVRPRNRKRKMRMQQSLRKDISKMEVKIGRERRLLDLWEASSAPRSVILCHLTEHVSLCGFCLEHFDDDKLILRFHHASQVDIETRVIFNLAPNKLTEVFIEPRYPPMKQKDSPFIECHEGFMRMLIGGMIPLTNEIRDLELRESTLKISRWLGRLDLLIAELKVIGEDCKVRIECDLPIIVFTMANGTVLHVTLDPTNYFLTRNVVVHRRGLNVHELPCEVGKSVLDIVSSING
jgi:hypothetical protein